MTHLASTVRPSTIPFLWCSTQTQVDNSPERKYSPNECAGTRKRKVIGKPVRGDISTHRCVERMNLNIRMGSRRFTRLTNAFSKKVDNHIHALAVYFMYYNFGRVHQSLRVTPAMEAGLTDHIWSLEELAAMAHPERKPSIACDIGG